MPDTWTPAQAEAENEAANKALDAAKHRRDALSEWHAILFVDLAALASDTRFSNEDRTMMQRHDLSDLFVYLRGARAVVDTAIPALTDRVQTIADFINAESEKAEVQS